MRLLGYLSKTEIDNLVGNQKERWDFLQNKLSNFTMGVEEIMVFKTSLLDIHGFLSHNLIVADKSSMRNSIELRVPYVDIDLYCNQIMNYKYKRSEMVNNF